MKKHTTIRKLRKALAILLTLCLILSLAPAVFADDATSGMCGENVTWTLDTETGVLTISGTGEMEDYDSISDTPWYSLRGAITTVMIADGVTSIGECAFEDCDNLVSVIISDSVISIGDWAFAECGSFANVTIGSNVTSIGYAAFYECGSLTSVTIPDSVTSICDYAFNNCKGLMDVIIGGNVTGIGYAAFAFCSSLTSVVVPDSVTFIDEAAFAVSSSLTEILVSADNATYCSEDGILFNKDKTELVCYPAGKETVSYEIPENVTTISNNAFCGCENLTSVTIGSGVTSVGNFAFYWCSHLSEILVSVDNTVYCSEDGIVFSRDMTGLICYPAGKEGTSCEIPGSVTSIGIGAFGTCEKLVSVTIPDFVANIGEYAFDNCTNLTSIVIPDSVVSIGVAAFYECESLCDVYYGGSESDWEAIEIGEENSPLLAATIHYNSTGSVYSGTCGENVTWTLDTETGLLTISGTGDMEDYESLTDTPWYSLRETITGIMITDGVTSIGEGAFFTCSSLTDITIGNQVTSIGYAAFAYCSSLTSVIIPASVTFIGNYAFQDCSSLTEIQVSAANTAYCSEDGILFSKDKTVLICYPAGKEGVSYEIPEGIISIGTSAFDACMSLTSVIIPDSVTSIENWTFADCSGLTSMVIPDSVTSIGIDAFYNCSNLTDLTIGNSVASIGSGAFLYCNSLTTVIIPDSVTFIGAYAFDSCVSLSSVTIGNGVTSIGEYAFEHCSSLSEILVSEDNAAYSSEDGVLFNKDKTELVCYPAGKKSVFYKIPGSVTSLANGAFGGCESLVSVYIPGSVTYIGEYAFSECSSLATIVIPSSVQSIEDYAFESCTSLASVVIPASMASIGEGAFDGCENLGDVYYGGSKSEWTAIEIGEENESLLTAAIHYMNIDSIKCWTYENVISGTGKWVTFTHPSIIWGIHYGNSSTVLSLPTFSSLLYR
ncbi:MAG: leucine-rich repeat domain-containing protein [Clostridiales bacterium]|nr:leucine-rich repeat domain-containing protein [Clostridiales bacterium]